MSELQSDTLYNAVRNSNKIMLIPSEEKYFTTCCCISEKWCFNHTGVASIREYDKNINTLYERSWIEISKINNEE